MIRLRNRILIFINQESMIIELQKFLISSDWAFKILLAFSSIHQTQLPSNNAAPASRFPSPSPLI